MSSVDEVVARLGGSLPVEVWVATYEEPYDSSELIGVTGTLERAKEIVSKRYPNEKIEWGEAQINVDSGTGKTYTWVQSTNGHYYLNLEEVQ